MSKLKLTYFDIPGGRVESARLALVIGGIDFEDFRFPFSDFAEVRKSTPLSQVPTMEVDGQQVTQCNAINRYVGKLTDLYPTDPLQALYCDEVMDGVEDVLTKLVSTFGLQGEEQKVAREALVAGALTTYLQWIENCLKNRGGEFFADNRLSVADLKIFVWIRGLNSGHLDHIPTDLVEKVAPALNAHAQRIAQIPAIVAYYS
jgi:glutathione S-transferase